MNPKMKPQLCARHLSRFFAPKKLVIQISHFNSLSSSTGIGNTISHSNRNRYEEESRNVRVSVWWDFENCNLPGGTNAYRVAQFVATAVRTNGIKGPIQITAFGDVAQLSRSNQEALSSTGINLAHVPNGGKNSADRSLLVDLMYWITQNPPPAHLFLISSDRDFAGILHRLRMNNYNILLASRESSPSVLCSAASIVWDWNRLINGENLSGKHYNRPPDGPFGSWYGHHKAPLEEPFGPVCTTPRVEGGLIADTDSDLKVRPIPKIVIKQIRQILGSYPKGISITGLRSELSDSGLNIDKDFYGYKKFSSLLYSLPSILTLISKPDGQYLVCSVDQNVSKEIESPTGITSGPMVNVKNVSDQIESPPRINSNCVEPKPTLPSSEDQIGFTNQKMKKIQKQPEESIGTKVTSPSVNLQEQAILTQDEGKTGKQQVGDVNNVNEGNEFDTQLDKSDKFPQSELGFFKRIWMKWVGPEVDSNENATKNDSISPENTKPNKKDSSLATANVESVVSDSDLTDREIPKPIESSFFNQIIEKFKFWRGFVDSNDSNEEVQEKPIKIESHSDKIDIFAKESFWVELNAFFNSAEASEIIIKSATRKQLVQNLHEKGPSILKSFTNAKLNHLLELLISNKKWIEESSSKTSPFKLVRVDNKLSLGNNSNGLSSVFSKPHVSSISQKKQELDGLNKLENRSLPESDSNNSFKKSQVLADCQKLIDELLKDRPEGFYMGSFRRLFLEKYGYGLDIEKLGYRKLSFLLETFSAVRIESTFVVPSRKSSSNKKFLQESKTKGSNGSDYDSSVWEELGPVTESGDRNSEKQSGLSSETKGWTGKKVLDDYESLSDDYLSESDDEMILSEKREIKKKPGFNEEESSLLQILESWHSSKKENESKKAKNKGFSKNHDLVADSSGSDLSDSGSNELKVKFETHANNGWKQRSSKSYKFVADEPMESRDRLIEGILGRLKNE